MKSLGLTTGRMAKHTALLLVCVLASGCMRTYLVPYDSLQAAEREAAAGADPERIAVRTVAPASRPDEPTRCLRLSHLPRGAPRVGELIEVRAADSHAERIGGATMTSMGASHYLAMILHAGISIAHWNACQARPDCLSEDFSLMITLPILGIIGSSLMAPGVTLAARGYGRSSDSYGKPTVERCIEPAPSLPAPSPQP